MSNDLTYEFKNIDNKKMQIVLDLADERVGVLSYSLIDKNTMSIDSVVVREEFRGRNFGGDLVDKAVEYATEKNMKIIPSCPFAKKVFDENPEYSSVLA